MPGPVNKQHNLLHGVKLEVILNCLHAKYGWEGLYERIKINCFDKNPSIKSSLTFLRKTPWAREKVENLYCYLKPADRAPKEIEKTDEISKEGFKVVE